MPLCAFSVLLVCARPLILVSDKSLTASAILFFFFCLFRAAPKAYRGSQARGQIRATATGLHHSHSNTRSELRLPPTPQLKATPDP